MIERIKNFAGAMKGMLLYIIGPSLAVAAYIVVLRSRNQDLKDQLEKEKSDATIKEILQEKEKANEESTQAELDYTTARDLYLRNQSVSGQGAHVPGSNQGSRQSAGEEK